MNRKEVLTEAEKVICKGRQDQYGNAEDSFRKIADYWNAYLHGAKVLGENYLKKEDVAMMMVLLKIARSQSNPKHYDNYVDICGYAALCSEIIYHDTKDGPIIYANDLPYITL